MAGLRRWCLPNVVDTWSLSTCSLCGPWLLGGLTLKVLSCMALWKLPSAKEKLFIQGHASFPGQPLFNHCQMGAGKWRAPFSRTDNLGRATSLQNCLRAKAESSIATASQLLTSSNHSYSDLNTRT
jgi:hypothetical protein